MTLKELYKIYTEETEEEQKKPLIICHWQKKSGANFKITNKEEFEEVLAEFKSDAYLMHEVELDDMHYFEYFTMDKSEPYIVVIKHPLLTHAYWKEEPDKIEDIFVSDSQNVYHHLLVDYGKGIKEHIIEFPAEIDAPILQFCREQMPQGFKNVKKVKKGDSTLSLVITNSDRYIQLDETNFVTYTLNDIFSDWEIKERNLNNVSNKFWRHIKKLGTQNG